MVSEIASNETWGKEWYWATRSFTSIRERTAEGTAPSRARKHGGARGGLGYLERTTRSGGRAGWLVTIYSSDRSKVEEALSRMGGEPWAEQWGRVHLQLQEDLEGEAQFRRRHPELYEEEEDTLGLILLELRKIRALLAEHLLQ